MREFDPNGTLRIIGYDVRVEERPYGHESMAEESRVGAFSRNKNLIIVSDHLAPDVKAQTVLHEAVHGLDDAMGLQLDEVQVECVARGFYALCRDNPDYMRRLLFD